MQDDAAFINQLICPMHKKNYDTDDKFPKPQADSFNRKCNCK